MTAFEDNEVDSGFVLELELDNDEFTRCIVRIVPEISKVDNFGEFKAGRSRLRKVDIDRRGKFYRKKLRIIRCSSDADKLIEVD